MNSIFGGIVEEIVVELLSLINLTLYEKLPSASVKPVTRSAFRFLLLKKQGIIFWSKLNLLDSLEAISAIAACPSILVCVLFLTKKQALLIFF